MYQLARLFSIVTVITVAYVTLLFAIRDWPSGAVPLAFFLLIYIVYRKRQRLTTLGSARWANEDDVADMLSAPAGLVLGRLNPSSNSTDLSIAPLFDSRVSSRHACRKFMRGLHRKEIVRFPQAIHTVAFGPSGIGKGVSLIVPWLMTNSDNAVVIDFKGENAKLTAEFRRKKFGHEIQLFDPFKMLTQNAACYNPIDWICKGNLALDECNDLGKTFIQRSGNEHDPHWNDWAEAWTAAMIATVVHYGKDDMRSLQTVRDFLSNPKKLEMAVQLMQESDAWSGMLARWGNQLSYLANNERLSTLSTVSRHMRFLDTLAVAESTRRSTFDPTKLRTGKMTCYLILPPEHMRAQSALLRTWITSLLRVVIAGGLQEQKKVHFILDEAASLGHLECIDDALDKYRGYGVRLQFYFQSLGQVKRCFPDGQDQTLLSNASAQTYIGVNDTATAEEVSKRLGEQTIVVDSGGTSSGSSQQWSQGSQPQTSGSTSYNANSNWSQQVRRLLKPEEVMALPPRTAITFIAGMPPVQTTLLRYYENPYFYKRFSRWSRAKTAFATLAVSFVFAVGLVVGAIALTADVNDNPQDALKMQSEAIQQQVAKQAAEEAVKHFRPFGKH